MGQSLPGRQGAQTRDKAVHFNMLFLSLIILSPTLGTTLYIFPTQNYLSIPLLHPSSPAYVPAQLPSYSPVPTYSGFGYSFGPGYHLRWGPAFGSTNQLHGLQARGTVNVQSLTKFAVQPFQNSKVSPLLTQLQNTPTGRQTGVLLA